MAYRKKTRRSTKAVPGFMITAACIVAIIMMLGRCVGITGRGKDVPSEMSDVAKEFFDAYNATSDSPIDDIVRLKWSDDYMDFYEFTTYGCKCEFSGGKTPRVSIAQEDRHAEAADANFYAALHDATKALDPSVPEDEIESTWRIVLSAWDKDCVMDMGENITLTFRPKADSREVTLERFRSPSREGQ